MNVIVLENQDNIYSAFEKMLIFHNERDILDYFQKQRYTVNISCCHDEFTVKIISDFGITAEYKGCWGKFVK